MIEEDGLKEPLYRCCSAAAVVVVKEEMLTTGCKLRASSLCPAILVIVVGGVGLELNAYLIKVNYTNTELN